MMAPNMMPMGMQQPGMPVGMMMQPQMMQPSQQQQQQQSVLHDQNGGQHPENC